MRTLSIFAAAASLALIVTACGSKNQQTQPSAAPTNTAYPGYPQAGQPGQPAQYPGQYPAPQPTYGGYPGAAPTAAPPAPPAAPTATQGGPMATPGPLAFSCQNDVPCGTHHCNMQYGKCAFPCQTANDCIPPNQCMAGLCVPTPPQAH